MSKLTFLFSCALFTFSLIKSTQQADVQNKDMQMKPDTKTASQKDMNDMNFTEVMNKCNESFIIDMAFIQALNESGSFPDETDRTAKCYVRCVLQMTGVASEDGVYDAKQAAVVLAGERGGKEMDDIEAMASSCTKRDEPCKCERAYQFLKCLMEKEIEMYEKSP